MTGLRAPEVNCKIDYLTVSITPGVNSAFSDGYVDVNEDGADVTEIVNMYVKTVLRFFGFERSYFGDPVFVNEPGGYDRKISNGSIKFTYHSCLNDKKKKLACRLELTGHGVDDYYYYYELLHEERLNWPNFFKLLLNSNEFNFTITRIDANLDAINMFNVPKPYSLFRVYFLKDNVFSSAKTVTAMINCKNRYFIPHTHVTVLGSTLYFGSPSSEQRLRIYDKLEEQKTQKKLLNPDIGRCIRFELQLRNSKAVSFVKMCIEEKSIALALKRVLGAHYRFYSTANTHKVENLIAKHKSYIDVPMKKWYRDILDNLPSAKLSCNNKITSIEKTQDWLCHSTDGSRYKVNVYQRILSQLTDQDDIFSKLADDALEIEGADLVFKHFGKYKIEPSDTNYCRKFIDDIRNNLVDRYDTSIMKEDYMNVEKFVIDIVNNDRSKWIGRKKASFLPFSNM